MKRVLAACVLATASSLASALDVNTASQAELEQLRGIGVELSEKLLAERARRPFSDWADLQKRVPGVGKRRAMKLSDEGLRVNEQPFPLR